MSTNKISKTVEIPQSNLMLSRTIVKSLGWSWPPLTGKIIGQSLPKNVLHTFRGFDRAHQRSLLSFGEQVSRKSITQEEMERLYRSTWDIRRILIDELAMIHAPHDLDEAEDQLWHFDGLSELIWLRMNFERLKPENKKQTKPADYPISINFSATHPLEGPGLRPTHPRAETHTINLSQAPKEGYWLLGFQDSTNPFHHINFSRIQKFANVHISPHVSTLGMIWLENGQPGPKNRVLFQKTASEEDLALFVWPQFQQAHWKKFENLPETPKIPIFQDEVVEICNGDRLLLLTTSYRAHRVHINLQISVKFHWASEVAHQEKIKSWIPNCEIWPNPTERYSHYLQRPLIYPSIIETEIEIGAADEEGRETNTLIQVIPNPPQVMNEHEKIDCDEVNNKSDCISLGEPKTEEEQDKRRIKSESENLEQRSSRSSSTVEITEVKPLDVKPRADSLLETSTETSLPEVSASTSTHTSPEPESASVKKTETQNETTNKTTEKSTTTKPSRKRTRTKDSLNETSNNNNDSAPLRKSSRLEECNNNKIKEGAVTRRRTIPSDKEVGEVEEKKKLASLNPSRLPNSSSGTKTNDKCDTQNTNNATTTTSSSSSSSSSTIVTSNNSRSNKNNKKSSIRRLR